MTRVAFEDMPWETGPAGLRFKVQGVGASRLRLLELTRELEHPHWCTSGHVGYILEGEMEVEFSTGTVVFRAGDGLAIPAGDADKHRPRALTDLVRMIFVEDNP
jgi:mannose-6-phosphate isomerase-like protein (cupin superfamily)